MQFVPINRAPGKVAMVVSALAHLAMAALLLWLVALARSRPVLLPEQAGRTQAVRVEPLTLPRGAAGARLTLAQKKTKHVAHKPQPVVEGDKEGVEAIRAQARQHTLALVRNFKFRTIYGFSPGAQYELPFQISGEMPVISADELPPRYEQYLIVEITIDSQGKVVDARLTAGQVDGKITDKLLAAIRQFKYRPATREGSPIASQTDLVIHIPT